MGRRVSSRSAVGGVSWKLKTKNSRQTSLGKDVDVGTLEGQVWCTCVCVTFCGVSAPPLRPPAPQRSLAPLFPHHGDEVIWDSEALQSGEGLGIEKRRNYEMGP